MGLSKEMVGTPALALRASAALAHPTALVTAPDQSARYKNVV
jgi:hypothetical protein